MFGMKQIGYPATRIQRTIFIIVALLAITGLSGLTLPPNAPNPGSNILKPSGLGLTGDYNVTATTSSTKNSANLNGVKLDLSRQGTFYFYLYLEKPTAISLKLYTDQNLATRGQTSLRLLDGKRKEITRASTVRCENRNTQPCTAVLVARNQAIGAYYAQVDIPTGRGKTAWLNLVVDANPGTSHTNALPWYNRDTLYGQIPTTTSNQWYKVNLASGKKYSLKLYGSSGSSLNLYMYSDTNTSKPLASATGSSYPKTLQVSVPGSSKYVYLRVENAKKTNTEYYISLIK